MNTTVISMCNGYIRAEFLPLLAKYQAEQEDLKMRQVQNTITSGYLNGQTNE